MTNRLSEGTQISNSVEVKNFTYTSKNAAKQLFEILTSLDIESASNDEITTLKMQVQLLIKNNLPYSNNTNDWVYHNALLAMLYQDYQEITQTIVHPVTLTRIEKNLQALCENNMAYRNNQNRVGEYHIEWADAKVINFTPTYSNNFKKSA
jgi:type III secretory pathway component EscV